MRVKLRSKAEGLPFLFCRANLKLSFSGTLMDAASASFCFAGEAPPMGLFRGFVGTDTLLATTIRVCQ